jgi:acetyltransferase-like isoleucine patch superfamily enzyme
MKLPPKYYIRQRETIENLIESGLLEIGEKSVVDEDVRLCYPTKSGPIKPVKIGKNCIIRSGTVIYSDVEIGDNCSFGHHAVVREGCRIGNNTSIGTGVKIECYTIIGSNVSIETQAHITGWMTIEDYVFVGGFVGSTNDQRMRWRRAGHGAELKGATLKRGCRIGSGAILMPAITIGAHAVINAGEVVRKDVPDSCLFFTKKGQEIMREIISDPIVEEKK